MLEILIAGGMVICAIMALRAAHLLHSAIWLAACSALTSILLYMLGATAIAVIELSVGAGLVTVLMVFAINITGEDASIKLPPIPKPLAWITVLVAVAGIAWVVIPNLGAKIVGGEDRLLADYIWSLRGADMMLQVVLIFSGVMGILSLLSNPESGQMHKGEEK